MEVSTEKFNALQELAEIQTQIATGSAQLRSLKETIEEYKAKREKDGLEMVEKALKNSQEALNQADQNLKSISALLDGVKDFALMVETLKEELSLYLKEHTAELEECVETIEAKTDEQKGVAAALKKQKGDIEAEDKRIAKEKDNLRSEWNLLNDRKEMFKRAVNRVNKV